MLILCVLQCEFVSSSGSCEPQKRGFAQLQAIIDLLTGRSWIVRVPNFSLKVCHVHGGVFRSDPSFEVKVSYLPLAFLPCFRWVESAPKWKLPATVDENVSDPRDKALGLVFEGVGAQTVLTLFFFCIGAAVGILAFRINHEQ